MEPPANFTCETKGPNPVPLPPEQPWATIKPLFQALLNAKVKRTEANRQLPTLSAKITIQRLYEFFYCLYFRKEFDPTTTGLPFRPEDAPDKMPLEQFKTIFDAAMCEAARTTDDYEAMLRQVFNIPDLNFDELEKGYFQAVDNNDDVFTIGGRRYRGFALDIFITRFLPKIGYTFEQVRAVGDDADAAGNFSERGTLAQVTKSGPSVSMDMTKIVVLITSSPDEATIVIVGSPLNRVLYIDVNDSYFHRPLHVVIGDRIFYYDYIMDFFKKKESTKYSSAAYVSHE